MPERNSKLTRAQAVEMWRQGKTIFFGEYRSSETETITWRDRQSGKTLTAPVLRHVVEFGNKSVVVSERVPDTFNPAEYSAPAKKGQPVVVDVASMETERGMISVRGALIPVID